MQRFKKKFFFITLGLVSPLSLQTLKVDAGSFGAEIFCTMRDGGNDHESSWDAAYTYIKKQKGGFFKVSPKQAAAQITESVIRDRETFSYCVEYLDQLHPNRKLIRDLFLEIIIYFWLNNFSSGEKYIYTTTNQKILFEK